MKVLVTGANGQLGRSLQFVVSGPAADENYFSQGFAKNQFSPAITMPTRKEDWLFTDVQELDITDLEAVRKMVKEEGIDVIVNCAGYTNVEEAEDKPDLAELLNAKAVENLAVAMKEVNGLLLHISTDYVFGGEPLSKPIHEDQKPAPQGVYAVTKLHGEEAIQRVGCRYIIIRTAWLFSEFGKNFVKTMLRLTAEKPSLKVVDDQRGTPTFASDLAAVIVRLLCHSERSEESISAIYHFTNEGECTWYEFACAIAELSGHTACDIQPCRSDEFPSKVHRPAYSVLDKSKIKGTLGISIPHWRDSLQRCLAGLIS